MSEEQATSSEWRQRFDSWFKNIQGGAFAAALLHLRDKDRAEEAVQIVAMDVFRYSPQFAEKLDFENYFFSSLLRFLSRRQQNKIGYMEDMQSIAQATPNFENREDLQRCIERLPEEDRKLIIAIYWEGITIREIADRKYMSRNTIGKQLSKARHRLRICLNKS